MLAEQRVEQAKWLKGTLTLRSDRFRERSDVTGEPRGSPCGHQGTTKFEFKSPSVHSVVHNHPTAKSEFRQAEIRQGGLTVWSEHPSSDTHEGGHPSLSVSFLY
ncbi:hypothetical protein E2C01_039674 [Portunus trituberculatus]|uniref:Uncharacterized protein n=1 Tax=Portunus trituberculatus TaxID=210409 RepID=A0A5B7FLW7_PORTR|nr:hypothetical protein [Portunus trituberculatus]